jgi:signal transduction histidine kinase
MATNTGTLLVVDDNLMNRKMLARSLEKEGHLVETVDSGMKALDMLRAGSFDVVLLDLLMPGMDGSQVLAAIKADRALRHIPVIMVSAQDELDSVVKCIEMGAEDYLPKPFNPVLLKARLNASLEKKKLRDLELMYLQQEVMLRQSEKLATLGKLSAGMAHELNNPASAVQRGAEQLRTAVAEVEQAHLNLDALHLSSPQLDLLLGLGQLVRFRATQPVDLDILARSDLEAELEAWLEDHNIDNGWEFAPTLVNLEYGVKDLAALVENFAEPQLQAVITWLNGSYTIYSLLEEMGQGAGRIAEIVKALKSYTYMDQAPIQAVDVHEGLDNTLVMLRSRLKGGINVQRHYSADLPSIQAYGSELNQVWTNIIDNASAAMQGQGEIILRTRREKNWVVVEIEDNGPGIPPEIQSKIFDPFFTTKPPGEGTGLGLNISHNIIVQKHQGQISVSSQPGRTCFQIKLPLDQAVEQI